MSDRDLCGGKVCPWWSPLLCIDPTGCGGECARDGGDTHESREKAEREYTKDWPASKKVIA